MVKTGYGRTFNKFLKLKKRSIDMALRDPDAAKDRRGCEARKDT